MQLTRLLNTLTKLFLFLLPWQTVFIYREVWLNGQRWQYGTLQFFATELFLWFIIVLFALYYMRRLRATRQNEPLRFHLSPDRLVIIVILLFILYSLSSCWWATDTQLALQHTLYILEFFLLLLVLIFGPLGKRELIVWTVLGSVLPALLGSAQFLSQAAWSSVWFGLTAHVPADVGASIVSVGAERFLRAYGPFAHPNVFGGYLVIALSTTLVWLTQFAKRLPVRIGLLCLIGLQTAALVFSFSRSAWLAAAVVTIGAFVLAWKKRTFFLAAGAGCILLVSALLMSVYQPLVLTRLGGQGLHETRSIVERISGYREAFLLWHEHPIWGVGPGNYTAQLLATYQMPVWQAQPVHNVILLFAVEYGSVGVGLVLCSMIALGYLLYRCGYGNRRAAAIILGGAVVVLPLFLFDHYLYSSYVGIMLVSVYGAAVVKVADI